VKPKPAEYMTIIGREGSGLAGIRGIRLAIVSRRCHSVEHQAVPGSVGGDQGRRRMLPTRRRRLPTPAVGVHGNCPRLAGPAWVGRQSRMHTSRNQSRRRRLVVLAIEEWRFACVEAASCANKP
jgi:hypothetical protein